jgi:hypothetical protein
MALKIIITIIFVAMAVTSFIIRISHPINVDERWYRLGKHDPFYHLMGNRTADLGRVLRFVISLIAVLGIVVVWLIF